MKITGEQLRLYAVTDRSWLKGRTLESTVEELLAAGVTCVQLREKNASPAEFLAMAKALRPICTYYRAPLIINDDLTVAQLSGADGVHLGQSDLPTDEARKILGPDKIIGMTAHNVTEAVHAKMKGADYLGCGALFGTTTKSDTVPLDRPELWRICKAVDIPVVAIGGINAQNAPLLIGTGIQGLAVVSALFAAADKTAAARQMRELADRVCLYREDPFLPPSYGRRKR